eukprot:4004898-Amphidinium_carterae.1
MKGSELPAHSTSGVDNQDGCQPAGESRQVGMTAASQRSDQADAITVLVRTLHTQLERERRGFKNECERLKAQSIQRSQGVFAIIELGGREAEMQEEVRIQNEMDNPSGTIRGQCEVTWGKMGNIELGNTVKPAKRHDKTADPRKKNYMVADEEESFSEQATVDLASWHSASCLR